jgi:hypothetical protein
VLPQETRRLSELERARGRRSTGTRSWTLENKFLGNNPSPDVTAVKNLIIVLLSVQIAKKVVEREPRKRLI